MVGPPLVGLDACRACCFVGLPVMEGRWVGFLKNTSFFFFFFFFNKGAGGQRDRRLLSKGDNNNNVDKIINKTNSRNLP